MNTWVRSLLILSLPCGLLVADSNRKDGPSGDPIPLARITGGDATPSLEFLACLGEAERGDTDAKARLASRYYLGEGTAIDLPKAVAWYLLAAADGDAKSMMILGMMHEDGDGVPRDPQKALRYFQMAADRGDLDAQVKLGVGCYESGNLPEARAWFRKAALQGDLGSQAKLGVMCFLGQGGPRDTSEAVTWLAKAAAQGDASAQGCLGLMYAVGDGVPLDPAEGYAWLARAEAGGNPQARQPLEQLERSLTLAQLEQGRRRAQALGAPRPAGMVAR